MSIFFTVSQMGQTASQVASQAMNTTAFDTLQPAFEAGDGAMFADTYVAPEVANDTIMYSQSASDGQGKGGIGAFGLGRKKNAVVVKDKGTSLQATQGFDVDSLKISGERRLEIEQSAREIVDMIHDNPQSVHIRTNVGAIGSDAIEQSRAVAKLLHQSVGSLMSSLGSEGRVLKTLMEVRKMMKTVEGPWYVRAMDTVSEQLPFGRGAGKRLAVRWEQLGDTPNNLAEGLKDQRTEMQQGIVALQDLSRMAKECGQKVDETVLVLHMIISDLEKGSEKSERSPDESMALTHVQSRLKRRKTQMILQRERLVKSVITNLLHMDVNDRTIEEIELTIDDINIGLPQNLAQLALREKQKKAQQLTGAVREFTRELEMATAEGVSSAVDGQLALERDSVKDFESFVATLKIVDVAMKRFEKGTFENQKLMDDMLKGAEEVMGNADKMIAEYQEARKVMGLVKPRAALEKKEEGEG